MFLNVKFFHIKEILIINYNGNCNKLQWKNTKCQNFLVSPFASPEFNALYFAFVVFYLFVCLHSHSRISFTEDLHAKNTYFTLLT